MPFDSLPALISFGDLSNKLSVEILDPLRLDDRFGAGVKLRRATIEISNDQLTAGIEEWLPWLKDDKGRVLSGKSATDTTDLVDILDRSWFVAK